MPESGRHSQLTPCATSPVNDLLDALAPTLTASTTIYGAPQRLPPDSPVDGTGLIIELCYARP